MIMRDKFVGMTCYLLSVYDNERQVCVCDLLSVECDYERQVCVCDLLSVESDYGRLFIVLISLLCV